MTISLKIFKIANIVEAILVTGLICTGLYSSPLPMDDLQDFLVLVFICSIPLVVCANCVNNILLVSYLLENRKVAAGKSVFFWVVNVLFLAFLIFVAYILYEGFTSISRSYKNDFPVTPVIVSVFIILGIIMMNGVAVLFSQLYFF